MENLDVHAHSAYFRQIFLAHYETLCVRDFRLVHGRKLSEDIVPDVFLMLRERRAEIDEGVSQRSEQCRRVFVLSRENGLKNREIAERLHISVKAAEKHIGVVRLYFRENSRERVTVPSGS